jgi:hypothetical protein
MVTYFEELPRCLFGRTERDPISVRRAENETEVHIGAAAVKEEFLDFPLIFQVSPEVTR